MYTITPIQCGILTGPKDALTYRTDRHIDFSFPVISFLITPDDPADDTAIIVDTGVMKEGAEYLVDRGRTVGPPGGGPEPLIDGLDENGLTPDDIDYVILTHLHHDHSSNNDLFSNAEFLLQRTELETARDPLPVMHKSFPKQNIESLPDDRLTLVECDYRLLPGIELLFTPGHSQGMQSVVVQTAGGPHALVGDLAYLQHNLNPGLTNLTDAYGTEHDITPMPGEYLPPGTHTSVTDCYESIEKIFRKIGDDGTIVISHDPGVPGTVFPEST